MKNTVRKRLLSALLSCVLVLGCLPVPALAEEPVEETVEETVDATVVTVPETEPETIPETEPETMPETIPETEPETLPEQILEEVPAEAVTPEDLTFDLSQGSITITDGAASGTVKVTYGGGLVTGDIRDAITITGTAVPGSDASYTEIRVETGRAFTLRLKDAALDNSGVQDSGAGALRMRELIGAYPKVTLILEGENFLHGGIHFAGISVLRNSELTIKGTGSLTAYGGKYAAGIGGNDYQGCGKVRIESGSLTVFGGAYAPGIGGGNGGEGAGTITITGGTVTATGGSGRAGIHAHWGTANIFGGIVTATGGENAPGIGGGPTLFSGTVNISGGVVTATGGKDAAGIGGGAQSAGGTVNISGGVVTAIGSNGAADIGGGKGYDKGTITRSGGVIFEKNSGIVYGRTTLNDGLTLAAGKTLTVPTGTDLTIPQSASLTITEGATLIVTNANLLKNVSQVWVLPGGTVKGLSQVAITQQPESNIRMVEGADQTLAISAGAGAAYQWYLGGMAIPGATEPVCSLAALEAGAYLVHCEVHFGNITLISTGSEVTVLPAAGASVRLTQDYVTLHQGNSTVLTAEVDPEFLSEMVRWSVKGKDVISVNASGEVTAIAPGTGYVIASITSGGITHSDRCRVDVTEAPSDAAVKGVRLGTSALTTELFRKDYSAFDVLLLLEQNLSEAAAFSLEEPAQGNGAAIDSARFADQTMAKLFDLAVQDDRTLLVVPTREAVDNPNTLGKRYVGKVIVKVCGKEYTTDSDLTLTVKQTAPKLKASVLTFNPFYTGQSQPIVISGATVTKITAVSLPKWLALEEGSLTLTEGAPRKGSDSAFVEVETAEWRDPIKLTLSVKTAYAEPKLKLNTSTVTLATFTEADDDNDYGAGERIRLLPANKKDTLESLNVSWIEAPEGWYPTKVEDPDSWRPMPDGQNLIEDDGWFLLWRFRGEKIEPCKLTLKVHFTDTDSVVELPLTVKTQHTPLMVRPWFSTDSYNLSSTVLDGFFVPWGVWPQTINTDKCELRWRILDKSGNDVMSMFHTYIREDGRLAVWTYPYDTEPGTYKLYIDLWDNEVQRIITEESAVMTFTVVPQNKKPGLTVSVSNPIDLSFPNPSASIEFKKNNYFIMSFENFEEIGEKAVFTNAKGDTVTKQFTFERDNNIGTWFICPNGNVPTGTYKLDFDVVLDGASPNGKVHCSTKFTVKRTPIKLKLSKTSLSLNKAIGDAATVDVTCLTKGYDLKQPIIKLIPPASKDGQDISLNHPGSQLPLDAQWNDGKLRVTAGPTAVAGMTYKLTLQATEQDTPVTLNVKITDAPITASLKAKGAIDPSRDGSAITVTPTYKNYAGLTDIQPTLTIESWSGKKGENYWPVENLFAVDANPDGSFTITKVPGAQVNTALKYRAKLTVTDGAAPAYGNLTIKSGTAKFAVTGTPALYKADRFSRGTFRVTTTDKTLNPIARAEIKDAKYQSMFEIHAYDTGEFAIGFRDNRIPAGKIPTSIPLNIFCEGCTAPTGTVTLKLQVQ